MSQVIGVQEELFIFPEADPTRSLGEGAAVFSSSTHSPASHGSLACCGPLDPKFSYSGPSLTCWVLKTKAPLNLGMSALLSFQILFSFSSKKNQRRLHWASESWAAEGWLISCVRLSTGSVWDVVLPNQLASPSSLYVGPESCFILPVQQGAEWPQWPATETLFVNNWSSPTLVSWALSACHSLPTAELR